VRAIGARLPALELDAIAFQEAWTPEARAELRAAGLRAGLLHAWSSGRATGDGGLLVLSKLPIRDARFEVYGARGLPERLWHGDYHAGKGFGHLRLETPRGYVSLLNTHLHAQYEHDRDDEYRALRLAQVLQLAEGLGAVADPIAALGDFNLLEEQLHYRVLTGLGGLADAAVLLGARSPTVLAGNPYARGRPRAEARIDYVFLRDGPGLALRPRSLERRFAAPLEIGGREAAYSDHAGLLVELELAPGLGSDPGLRPGDVHGGGGRRTRAEPDWVAAARALLEEGRLAAASRRRSRLAVAGAAAVGAAFAWTAAPRATLTRRRLLRALLATGGSAALAVGAGAVGLAAGASREELRALDEALARLDRLAPSTAG
jgi:endonuclease/exonuclease/phosphatase family metal-dependent hydrolase